MKFSLEIDASMMQILRYEDDGVEIGIPQQARKGLGVVESILKLDRSFILTPHYLQQGWPPKSISDLTLEHLEKVLQLLPFDLLLLGTGDRIEFPNPSVLVPLYQQQIGVEVMDSRAASRTFNVLAAEGRQVVAAIMKSEHS